MVLILFVIVLLLLEVGLFVKVFSFNKRLEQIEVDLLKVKQVGNVVTFLQRELEILKSRASPGTAESPQPVRISSVQAEKPALVAPPLFQS